MLKKLINLIYNAIRFIGEKNYKNLLCCSASTYISVDKRGTLDVGGKFRTRRNVELNIRENASLEIGDNVFINSDCIITCRKKIKIGSGVIFGPSVKIFDNDHAVIDGKIMDNDYICDEITICDGTWIGSGSIILKGVNIGANVVVAAGSVVNKDIPDNSIFVQKKKSEIYER